MNLDPQDLEMIRATVAAAVSEATRDLATKAELREFRAEVRDDRDKQYTREMIDLFRAEDKAEHQRLHTEIDELKEQLNKQGNTLENFWSTTFGKVATVLGSVASIAALFDLIRMFQQ